MACFWQGKVKLFDGIYLNKKKNQKKSKSQSCWVTWYIPNVSTTCCHPNLFHSSMLRGSFQTSDRSLTDLFKFIWNAHIHTLILQFFLKDTEIVWVWLSQNLTCTIQWWIFCLLLPFFPPLPNYIELWGSLLFGAVTWFLVFLRSKWQISGWCYPLELCTNSSCLF